ncbi:unnamed protein product [Clonostachys solani]|uniref:Uncharacterized protein n=1 Tax=Clonostachys solani TaxID=160281 RepID=A0A9N9Z9N9_9HYPO|nr:unnamed protein product [Clonostachys solani]
MGGLFRRNPTTQAIQTAGTQVFTREGPYAHLKLDGMHDAIVQVEEHRIKARFGREDEDTFSLIPYSQFPDPSQPFTASPIPSEEFIGHYRNWLPFRLIVRDRAGQPENVLISDAVRAVTGNGDNVTRISAEDDLLADAIKLVQTARGSKAPSHSLSREENELNLLPMASTKLNKELVRTFLRLLCRFKGSVSGTLDDNQLRNRWTNVMIQEPLLMKVTLFTSACFLNEIGFIPKSVVIALRGIIYTSLNEQLASRRDQISDATILAVCEMVMDEWFWGATEQLHAHMTGLRVMIQMRGGLRGLGMHGYLSKMILVHDYVMAIAHDTLPEMYGLSGYEFEDPVLVPFETSLNSPLMAEGPSFASSTGKLHLHPCTAIILDEVRTMIYLITSLPIDANAEQTSEAVRAAHWVNQRIGELPENVSLNQVYNLNKPTGFTVLKSHKSMSGTASETADSPDSSGFTKSGQSPKQSSSSSGVEAIERENPELANPDQMYSLVRLTASIYCRAIINRAPTSEVCNDDEFLRLWQLIWRIPVAARRSIVGIFLWALIAIAPSCHTKAPARFIRTLITNSYLTIAVENWHLGIEAANAALNLQRWLRGSTATGGLIIGGEGTIERYGWAQKEVLKNIATIHKASNRTTEEEDEDEDQNDGEDHVMRN